MKIKVYIAKGGSMRPTINNNDFIFTKNVTFDKVKNGDIIAYRCDGGIFLHRVLSKNKFGVVVGSDSDSVDKHYVKGEHIIGVVITPNKIFFRVLPFIFRFFRTIKKFMKLSCRNQFRINR